MAYGTDPAMGDGSSRDAITQALMQISNPPPGGIAQPAGGMPPAMGQQGGQAPPGGMMQPQAPVGGMAGQMPGLQPAAFGTALPPGGPMGPIGGPYSSAARLPGITPQF
jgi:hypothetical protein